MESSHPALSRTRTTIPPLPLRRPLLHLPQPSHSQRDNLSHFHHGIVVSSEGSGNGKGGVRKVCVLAIMVNQFSSLLRGK